MDQRCGYQGQQRRGQLMKTHCCDRLCDYGGAGGEYGQEGCRCRAVATNVLESWPDPGSACRELESRRRCRRQLPLGPPKSRPFGKSLCSFAARCLVRRLVLRNRRGTQETNVYVRGQIPEYGSLSSTLGGPPVPKLVHPATAVASPRLRTRESTKYKHQLISHAKDLHISASPSV